MNSNRRLFLQKLGLVSFATGTSGFLPVHSFTGLSEVNPEFQIEKLTSLPPTQIFSVLNLELPQLEKVRTALDDRGHDAALSTLLEYYRDCYPKQSGSDRLSPSNEDIDLSRADNVVNHVFQWGPYPPVDYGKDIDWAADPAGDIEWVAAVYRFYWANDLINAFEETGDGRYANTFVELTKDWIKKHPLEKTLHSVHPVYGPGVYGTGGWRGYAWLDLQTGIRVTNICRSFRVFLHEKAFTPQFLGVLLASLYDHQVKTEKMPMGKVHNKAIFEQRGFFNVIHTFPEFKDKDRWLDTAIILTCENLLAQTTTDGVQREWCGGYHTGVYRDAMEIESRVRDLGREMPQYYISRTKGMADHIFGIATPELGFPMFGDTARNKAETNDREKWQLYDLLIEASDKFDDPKFQALADLNVQELPENGSYAFPNAGLYALRNNWTPDQVYMPLHCSPEGITIHDAPDNGTFELYAYGRWLMPDTGFYTYGNDPEARAWHRQTRRHPTMTVNGNDTGLRGRQLYWKSEKDQDVLCFENQSYPYFLHRRTVWFVNKTGKIPFFILLDEAIGDMKGDIALHFPMAPGHVSIDQDNCCINTGFDNVNLHILVAGKQKLELREEEGWHAWEYGKREPRTSVSAIYKGQAPFTFVSILLPYKGKNLPACKLLTDPTSLIAGNNPMKISVEIGG